MKIIKCDTRHRSHNGACALTGWAPAHDDDVQQPVELSQRPARDAGLANVGYQVAADRLCVGDVAKEVRVLLNTCNEHHDERQCLEQNYRC